MSSSSENVTDRFLTINGLNIHYRDWGEKHFPPLVILHGAGNAHSRSWDHVAAALTDQYRVIVPDLRGHGESSWVPVSQYTWQLILEDTLSLIDTLGLSATALCGHSLGGRVAYMLASQHPQPITRLVLVEADPMDPNIREDEPPIELFATIEEAVVEACKRQPYAEKDTLRHETEHGLKQLDDSHWTWRMDPAIFVALWRGQLNPGTKLEWPALAQIRCPSVLIYGTHSMGKGGSMNEPRIVEKIGRPIPNCQLIEIPDASHDLPNENPIFFIRALRAHLTDLSSATDRSTGKNPSEINYEG